MDGQAIAPEMSGVGDLADFLSDKPEAEPHDEEDQQNVGQEDQDGEQDDQPGESEGDSEPKDAPTPDRTFKVKVKGDDGADTEKEVTEKELLDGYMMRQDYTRKTQGLADREREVTQQLSAKFEEHRNHYLHEAQLARAAIVQLAGLRSAEEMAHLAHQDPAAWVAENQRQQTILTTVSALDERIRAEQSHLAQAQQGRTQQAYESAWQELSKSGIDRQQLAEIYQKTCDSYGFKMEDFSAIYDPRAVKVLKDNIAMREELAAIKEKAKAVTKQAQEAPRIPNKQAQAASERKARDLNSRFKSGNAKLADLASFLK